MTIRKINEAGVEMIKRFEGFSATTYRCVNGYETIGFGHKIVKNETYSIITLEEAEKILIKDLEFAENAVSRYVIPDISANQFAALVSFTYNLGVGALQRSSLRQKINYGSSLEDIKEEFLRWVFCAGRRVSGLVKRRYAESTIYCLG